MSRYDELADVDTPRPEDPPSPPPAQFAGKTVRQVEDQIEANRRQEDQ